MILEGEDAKDFDEYLKDPKCTRKGMEVINEARRRYNSRKEIMARPIELGLTLEGEDAKDFDEYLKNPTITPRGYQLMKEAEEMVTRSDAGKKRLLNMTMSDLRNLIHDLPDDVLVKDYFGINRLL